MLKMQKVGPSTRAKDAPIRQDLRLEFAPALESLTVGGDGIQIALPAGMEATRFRSLINAVSNQAGYTVATELAYKANKKGELVLDAEGKKTVVAVNVYKTGTKEPSEAPAPPKASQVQVPDADGADDDFDPLAGTGSAVAPTEDDDADEDDD